jgi:predicted short-subunit dehydrogenase-like oxidoreductase (DUF2520 family)
MNVGSVDSRALRVGFIGAGRAANALAPGLHDKGYQVTSVSSRTLASAEAVAGRIQRCTPLAAPQDVADGCDLVFITAPDDSIETIAQSVRWHSGMWVTHCSGVESASVLECAQEQGAIIGSFHPMQTFATTNQETAILSGIAFAVEGTSPLIDTLREMAHALGGWPVEISPQHRALYHLSGFLACGAVVTLMSQAAELWKIIGYTKEQGLEVLIPILKSTVASLEAQGTPGALTGPISRGDLGTVQKHLDALEGQAPSILPIYCEIALGSVALSRDKGGIKHTKEQEITTLLEERLAKARTLFVG